MRDFIHAMMEQNALVQARLEAAQKEAATAQRTVTVVAERMSAPVVHDRAGNIVDFHRLHPTTFSKQLNYMENFLEVACIPPKSQGDVMKIQLTNIFRTWWKSKEAQLERSIVQKVFLNGSYVRFSPLTAQDDME